MPAWELRPARRSDVRTIVALWHEMMAFHHERDPRFRFGPTVQRDLEQHLYSTLRSREAVLLVAVAEAQVVGYLLGELHRRRPIYPVGAYGFISDLCVTERWRRRGIGSALVERALAWFQEKGVTAVELLVADRNPAALDFWRRMGWTDYLRLMRLDTQPDPS
jgi:ribosomal protein S18 acetylase RimI-like enzyme